MVVAAATALSAACGGLGAGAALADVDPKNPARSLTVAPRPLEASELPVSAVPASVSDVPANSAGIIVSPVGDGLARGDAELTVDLTIVNRTQAALPAGTATLSRSLRPLGTRAAVADWRTRNPQGEADGESPLGSVAVGSVAPGTGTTVTIRIPADHLPGGLASASPAASATWGLRAALASGQQTLAQGTSLYTQDAGALSGITPVSAEEPHPLNVATIVPIVAPNPEGGLLSPEELTAATSPGGQLAKLLDAVTGTNATLAVDPRVTASIRILGARAPQAATAWLRRLEALPNPVFRLRFADADAALATEAGHPETALNPDLTALEQPADFGLTPEEAQAQIRARSTAAPSAKPAAPSTNSPAPVASSTASPAAAATPTTSAQPAKPASPQPNHLPSAVELLRVEGSLGDLAWPAAGAPSRRGVERMLTERPAAMVLDSTDVEAERTDAALAPSVNGVLGDARALILDHELSAATEAAAHATDDRSYRAAAAHVVGLLAASGTALREAGGTDLAPASGALLVSVGRRAIDQPERLRALLEVMESLSWTTVARITPSPLPNGAPSVAVSDPVATTSAETGVNTGAEPAPVSVRNRTVALRDGTPSADGTLRVSQLASAEALANELSSMYDDGSAYRAEIRARVLGVLAARWRQTPAAWQRVTQSLIDSVNTANESVDIAPTSDVQLIGTDAAIPVFIHNKGTRRVTVRVRLDPTSPLLTAREPVSLVIEPGAMNRALLHVSAAASGTTTAAIEVLTPNGTPLRSRMTVQVFVRAEIEKAAFAIMIAAISALLVIGIVRTVRRRRRARPGEDAAEKGVHDGDD